jgi:rod shape-determining protein MreC
MMVKAMAIRRTSIQRIVVPLLFLLSTIMIILGKIDQVLFESMRISVTDAAVPLLDLLSRPLSAIDDIAHRAVAIADTYQENHRLSEENSKLLHWQQAALLLSAENKELRKLLKVVPEPGITFVTARVVARSGGAYMQNVLVDTGSENGVARGQAALTGEGLFGRVYEVGARSARILSLTDLNSRIPVIVERSRQRAILAGDNSEAPFLQYLDPADPLNFGDRVMTSGEGGVFPPGIPVGVVALNDRGFPRVVPFVRLSDVEFLRIADFGLAGELPPPVSVKSTVLTRPRSANCR